MKVLHCCCAALIVTKSQVECCSVSDSGGEHAVFRSDIASLRRLGRWLIEREVTSVALEASGTYWKPVWNLLESEFGNFTMVLTSMEHLRQAPGRPAECSDVCWLATLHRYGMVRGSRIPERDKRELQELMKARHQLILDRQRMVGRIRRVLLTAGVRLRSLVIDVTGKAGLSVLRALVSGERSPERLIELIENGLRGKPDEVLAALDHSLEPHQRLLVDTDLQVLESLTRAIEKLDREVERRMRPSQKLVDRLQEIPGIALRSAQEILAYADTETGLQLNAAAPPAPAARARKGVRCEFSTEAYLEGRSVAVKLMDLSLGGAKLTGGAGFQRGKSIQLRNPLPGRNELVEARVVWVRARKEEESAFDIGLRFEDSPETLGRSWVVGLLHQLRAPQAGRFGQTPAQLPAEIVLPGGERVAVLATSLGLGGITLNADRSLRAGAHCSVILGPMANLLPLELKAEVVASTSLGEQGRSHQLRFEGISSTQVRLLGRYLVEQVKNGSVPAAKS